MYMGFERKRYLTYIVELVACGSKTATTLHTENINTKTKNHVYKMHVFVCVYDKNIWKALRFMSLIKYFFVHIIFQGLLDFAVLTRVKLDSNENIYHKYVAVASEDDG